MFNCLYISQASLSRCLDSDWVWVRERTRSEAEAGPDITSTERDPLGRASYLSSFTISWPRFTHERKHLEFVAVFRVRIHRFRILQLNRVPIQIWIQGIDDQNRNEFTAEQFFKIRI
jgi:hypothetical protein